MTTLTDIYNGTSDVSSVHSAGRKRGRAKPAQVQTHAQQAKIDFDECSSTCRSIAEEETSIVGQVYHLQPNYQTLADTKTNKQSFIADATTSLSSMNNNRSSTTGSVGVVGGDVGVTSAVNSDETYCQSAAASPPALRRISDPCDFTHNEDAGHGDYASPPSRPQLLHYLLTNWKSLALGQVLSVLLSTAGITQSTLYANCGLSAPTLSVAFVYLINSFHLCRLRNRRNRGERLSVDADIDDDDDWSVRLETNEEIANGRRSEPNETNTSKASTSKGAAILRMSSTHPTHTFCGLPIHAPPWIYMILAFLDVEANYLTVLAYRYTTLTSVTLFDALAIPSAMMLSKWWLGRAYGRIHLVGVALCMAGVVVNVMQDYKIVNEDDDDDYVRYDDDNTSTDPYPYRIRGDILAICGGILYGVNDTVCEIAVRAHGHASEFLGMVGLFAGVIAIVQAAIVEREAIAAFFVLGNGLDGDDDTCSAFTAWGLLAAFVGVNVISYSGAAMFLLLSEAAFFNLSLLTGDLWTVIFSVTAQHIIPGPLFFIALLLIVGGVVIYEMAPSPVEEKALGENDGRPREDSFEMTQGSPCYQCGELA